MKLYSLLTLLLVANAKELFMDDYNTELGATVTDTAADKKAAAAAALAKKDKDAKDVKKVKKPKCPVLTGAALATAEAKKCSCQWKLKNGWSFGCMWDKPGMQITGCFLMVLLITLSNAGGMSGAGSNIPIMLIFFNMDMHIAVPISAFVAVCATGFRFGINFKVQHPNRPERNVINYEVVTVTMPLVFLGSLIGVEMGPIIGNTAQMVIFGIVVAWSIYISGKKAFALRREENEKEAAAIAANADEYMEMGAMDTVVPVANSMNTDTEGTETKTLEAPLIDHSKHVHVDYDGKFGSVHHCYAENEEIKENDCEELQKVKADENRHVTPKRMLFYFVNFCFLFAAQMIVKNPLMPVWARITTIGVYLIIAGLSTRFAISIIDNIHRIKNENNYNWDEKDIRFHNRTDIIKMALACMLASILCGMTGIAGGMVLGPLFLKYNMVPIIMSSTNQYITLLASFSVFIQFALAGEVTWDWAMCFGLLAFLSAFIGIVGIQALIKRKGGKQSFIAFVMFGVLIAALISLPLKAIFLAPKVNSKALYDHKTKDQDGQTVF